LALVGHVVEKGTRRKVMLDIILFVFKVTAAEPVKICEGVR
jgi:hypothetical protein